MNDKELPSKEGEIIKIPAKRSSGVVDLGKKIYIGTINIFLPPLAHWHTGRYTGKKHHLVLDTFLAFLIFVLIGVSWFYRAQIRKIFFDEVTLTVLTSQSLKSGQEEEFKVRVVNKTKEVFKDGQVRVESANKQLQLINGEADHWQFSELTPQEEKTFSFKAVPLGMVGEKLKIKSLVSYTTSRDEKRGMLSLSEFIIEDSGFSVSFKAPEIVTIKKVFETKIILKSGLSLKEGYLRLIKPDSFMIKSQNPKAKDNQWEVKEKLSEKELILSSVFSNTNAEKETIWMEYYIKIDDQEIILARKDNSYVINYPALSLSLASNSSSLLPGQETNFTVTYKNISSVVVSEAKITCSFKAPENVLGLTLKAEKGLVAGHTITFTTNTQSSLSSILPNQSESLSFQILMAGTAPLGEKVEINCFLSGTQLKEEGEVEIMVYAEPLTFSLSPLVSFAVYGRYTDFGAGSLPPKVGYPTIYRLFFEINDPSKSIHDLFVSVELPKGVDYLGNVSALAGSSPQYNEANRKITWSIAKYPKEAVKIQASFEVRIIPNKNHLGHSLELLSESELTFLYAGENYPTKFKADHLTTELKGDPEAMIKGLVTE